MRICAFSVMPGHWYLLLWPELRWRVGEVHATAHDHPCEVLEATTRSGELESLRRSVHRERPFGAGTAEWQNEIANRQGVQAAFGSTGRTRNAGYPNGAPRQCRSEFCRLPMLPIVDLSRFRFSHGYADFETLAWGYLTWSYNWLVLPQPHFP